MYAFDPKAVDIRVQRGNPKGGITAYEMYQTLSKMAIKQAIMLDGGGAPGIIEKKCEWFCNRALSSWW